MAQTLQSLYQIPAVVPQLGINNTFTATNTFSGALVSTGVITGSNYGTPYVLTDPGGTAGNWYTLGTVTFNAGSGSACRIEINGSASYTTGSQIAGHDVIELRMGNNTSSSTSPDVTGNYYRIGDKGNSAIVAGTLKLVSVNSSVTDNAYTIWYQSNTFVRTSRVYFYSSDATFVFSGAYQSSGDPAGTVSNPALYLYVVPNTVSLKASVINTMGRLLVNTPTDDSASALLVNGTSTLGATVINGSLNVNATSVFSVAGTEYDMFFQTGGSLANRVYLATGAVNFAIAYTDASGNYLGSGFQMSRSSGAVTIPISLSIPAAGNPLVVGSNTAGPTYINVNAAAGNNHGYTIQNAGLNRWVLYAQNNAETGGNAGSDFILSRYTDAGAWIDNPITIIRSTGQTIVSGAGGLAVNNVAIFNGTTTFNAATTFNTTTSFISSANFNTVTATSTWPIATGTIANGGGGGNYGFTHHANNNGGSTATSAAALTFIRDGIFGCFMGYDTDSSLKVGGWSYGNVSYLVYHQGIGCWTPQVYTNYQSGAVAGLGNGATGIGGAGIWNDNGTYKTLMIIGNTSAGGNRQVSIWDALTVNGPIQATGQIGMSGLLTSTVGSLGSAAGNSVLITTLGTGTSNVDKFRLFYYRNSAGTGWDTASLIMDRLVDSTSQQQLRFCGSSVGNRLELWHSGSTITAWTSGADWVASSWMYANNFQINSDRRIKTDDYDLDPKLMLEKIMLLKGKWYMKEGHAEYGHFAQEVKEVFPDMVHTYNDIDRGINDMHALSAVNFHAPHIAATQELYRKIQRLEARISELESSR